MLVSMKQSPAQRPIAWKSLGKVAIFIDAANVIYSLRDLGWRIDYKRLQSFFDKKTTLGAIYFYSAYFDDDEGRKNLLDMLSRKGFIIRSKVVKKIRTKDGKILHKANCDVELTMDAMTVHHSFDTIILMSGDSDFVPVLNYLKSQQKQTVVISTRGHVARELIEAADTFLHFDSFRAVWQMALPSKNPAKRGSR